MARAPRRIVAALLTAGVLYYLVSLGQVMWAAHLDQVDAAQAIVVLGSAEYDGRPSPDLAARLSHALDLWRRKVAGVIVTTGGKEPADVYTEADAGADWLEARGVPRHRILAVVDGRDTWQSLQAVSGVLAARGISTVVLVSDPFHDERIRLMSSSLGMHPRVSPTRTSPIRGGALVPYYAKEAVEVAASRIVGWRRLSQLTRSLAALGVPSR